MTKVFLLCVVIKNLVASFIVISDLIRKRVISHHPIPTSLPLNGSFLIVLTAKRMSEQ